MLRKHPMNRRWVAVLPLALAMFTLVACGKSQATKDSEAREASYRDKYAKAKALFEDRCKTSGVVVKRTVQDVEGIELTKVRQPLVWDARELFDPMYPDAALANELRGDDYIKQFLLSEFRSQLHPEKRGAMMPHLTHNTHQRLPPTRGYRFVEYSDLVGNRYRCEATWKDGEANLTTGQHRCEPVKTSMARYALDYEDMVDTADRSLWVAGTKLKVVDKSSGEVIAQLTRFVWDPGFGVSTSGRRPWEHANASDQICPNVVGTHRFDSRYFVDTVLIPKQGD
jgi:hypothetical protein